MAVVDFNKHHTRYNTKIFLDMDGVIADWNGAAHRLFKCEHDKDQDVRRETHWFYDSKDQDELWRRVNLANEEFWTGIEPYRWTNQVVELVRKFDPEFAFLTSPSTSPVAASGKLRWLQCHFPNDAHRFILTGMKEFCAAPGRVLIDDSEKYEAGWNAAGGTFILFASPWNRLQFDAEQRQHFSILRDDLIDAFPDHPESAI